MNKIAIFGLAAISIILIGAFAYLSYSGNEEHEHEDEHDHSVEIEGSEMKILTVQEVADLWEIDSEVLLSKMISQFDLKESYTADSVLEDIREEYAFSPALIKDMAEEIKQGIQNE
ncbi:hypothetical protein KAS08_03220 [Candidatus Pacearchaeota archaeon]|nr:hypothetical protein [Candidatus Pacearchaeota archaeon]